MSTVFQCTKKKKRNHVGIEKLHGTTFILISKKKFKFFFFFRSYLGSGVLSRCRRNGAVQLAFFFFQEGEGEHRFSGLAIKDHEIRFPPPNS